MSEQNEPVQDGPIQNGPTQDGPTQNGPIQDGASDASRDEKLAGLVAQVSADARDLPQDDVRRQLDGRLRDSGIPVSDEELEALLARIVDQP